MYRRQISMSANNVDELFIFPIRLFASFIRQYREYQLTIVLLSITILREILDYMLFTPERSSEIEQFFRRPASHNELVKNMRTLKLIPKDISDPKVVVKLR